MDPLLEPISEASPCGVDLSYDPVYSDLAVLIEGTPENQYEPGSAKEPNWASIRKISEDALKRSKDLQMGVYFTVSLMQTTGIAGALRGADLIAGMVRTYWDGLFPALDPEDPDPTQRVNILSQLTVEPSSYGDPIKFIDRLNQAPIFRVPGMAVSMSFLAHETTPGAGTGAARLPELMANGNPEETAAGIDALRQLAATVHSIDDFLIEKLGRDAAPSFDLLIKALGQGAAGFRRVDARRRADGRCFRRRRTSHGRGRTCRRRTGDFRRDSFARRRAQNPEENPRFLRRERASQPGAVPVAARGKPDRQELSGFALQPHAQRQVGFRDADGSATGATVNTPQNFLSV